MDNHTLHGYIATLFGVLIKGARSAFILTLEQRGKKCFTASGRGEKRLRCRRLSSKARMSSHRVVIVDPPPTQNFSLTHISEQLPIEELVPHSGVKAFAIAVLPRAARLNVSRYNPQPGKPCY